MSVIKTIFFNRCLSLIASCYTIFDVKEILIMYYSFDKGKFDKTVDVLLG